jgi:hypothetical protein
MCQISADVLLSVDSFHKWDIQLQQPSVLQQMKTRKTTLLSRANAARKFGVNRSTISRYVQRNPSLEVEKGLIDAVALREVIEKSRGRQGRGFPLGVRRFLPVKLSDLGGVPSFQKRVAEIRRKIDLLSDDEQAFLKGQILGFFRPELPSWVGWEARAEARLASSQSDSTEAESLANLAREVLAFPGVIDYATGGEIHALERAARGEFVSAEERGLVKKLARLLLHRVD